MLSIQTNVDSLIAQQNLNINNQFQSNTIQQLTSGYRINSAGDDAAGLAVANQYRDQIAELNQGVLNANDGASQLQIMDGGLDNISTMLDRLQTLATESASSTFTGDRSTLQNEYQNLLNEVDRQANNIGLGAADSSNLRNIGVYIGGGQDANTNSTVNVNLSQNSGVGTAALGIASTGVLTNAAVTMGANVSATTPVTASAVQPTDTATSNFQTAAGAAAAIVITGQTNDTLQNQINELNTNLQNQNLSITASLNAAGQLQFQSSDAFSVNATTASTGLNAHPDNLVSGTTANATANNTGLNNLQYVGGTGLTTNSTDYDVQITVGTTKVVASLTALVQTTANIQANVATINSALKAAGITTVSAVVDQTAAAGTTIDFQGSSAFSVADDGGTAGTFTNNPGSSTAGAQGTGPQTAINAITAAIAALGQTQGKIGAGENTLNYAINLAQSQITNFSSAESQIRDANVAQEAANLTKAQVLQQTSIAAMAQANAEPQALLKLFQ